VKTEILVLWNQAVHPDREVIANRPDIIIKNKKDKTCTLIDVAASGDSALRRLQPDFEYLAMSD